MKAKIVPYLNCSEGYVSLLTGPKWHRAITHLAPMPVSRHDTRCCHGEKLSEGYTGPLHIIVAIFKENNYFKGKVWEKKKEKGQCELRK